MSTELLSASEVSRINKHFTDAVLSEMQIVDALFEKIVMYDKEAGNEPSVIKDYLRLFIRAEIEGQYTRSLLRYNSLAIELAKRTVYAEAKAELYKDMAVKMGCAL